MQCTWNSQIRNNSVLARCQNVTSILLQQCPGDSPGAILWFNGRFPDSIPWVITPQVGDIASTSGCETWAVLVSMTGVVHTGVQVTPVSVCAVRVLHECYKSAA